MSVGRLGKTAGPRVGAPTGPKKAPRIILGPRVPKILQTPFLGLTGAAKDRKRLMAKKPTVILTIPDLISPETARAILESDTKKSRREADKRLREIEKAKRRGKKG